MSRIDEGTGADQDGWMDGRADGRMDGRTDGWMDGWMDACNSFISLVTLAGLGTCDSFVVMVANHGIHAHR